MRDSSGGVATQWKCAKAYQHFSQNGDDYEVLATIFQLAKTLLGSAS